MNVRNLHIFHRSNEFLILKYRTRIGMHEQFETSYRIGKVTLLVTPQSSKYVFYVGSLIWNVVRKLIEIFNFSLNSCPVKAGIKQEILNIQSLGNPVELQSSSWGTLQYNYYK